MNEGYNLPIGIILCADKSDSVAKYTLPEEELKQELQKEQEILETQNKL